MSLSLSLATSADRRALSERLKAQAYGLGFELAGIAALGEPATRAHFDAWIASGQQGEMAYLAGDGAALRGDTRLPHAGATHALVVAMNYGGTAPSGPVARYARGDDYHDVLRAKLRELHAWLENEIGAPVHARSYVDTGPVLERDLAQRAGLGWFGKNTMLINPQHGSFLFLASLFVDVALETDAPFDADRCGSCTRCIDACPTQAITGPRELDARRCISYLTIELKGAIPVEFREAIGALIYGCDICQDVCPWNQKFAKSLAESSPFFARASVAGKDARALALELLTMSTAEYTAAFRGSPMKRAKLRGLKRNAAVVLGNTGSLGGVPALTWALSDDEPIVRGHAAWALGRIATPAALEALRDRVAVELDPGVLAELSAATSAAARSLSRSAK